MATVDPISVATAGFINSSTVTSPLAVATRGFCFQSLALDLIIPTPRKRVGKSTSKAKPYEQPQLPEMIDLFFETHITRLNEKNLEIEPRENIKKRYRIPKESKILDIKIENLNVNKIKKSSIVEIDSLSNKPKKLKPYISSSLFQYKPKPVIFNIKKRASKKKK